MDVIPEGGNLAARSVVRNGGASAGQDACGSALMPIERQRLGASAGLRLICLHHLEAERTS
jgi:hypothetical protein